MQTRSGRTTCSPKVQQYLQEIRIPPQEGGELSTNMSRSKTGRVGKRQKSAKTVRFENELCFTENESPSGRHPYRGGRPVQADEHSLHSRCEDLSTELNAEADGFTAGFDDIEMLEFEQEEQEPQRLDVDNNNKENKDPLRSGNACILEISADDRDKVALTQEELDGEHQSQYRALKISAWEWADTYFSVVTPAAEKSLDLLNLCTSSPELMEYANYISACTNDAWEYVFNGQRRFLVYCILGKMLDVHIFGHEMFGATEEQLKELRKMDGELVMEDGT